MAIKGVFLIRAPKEEVQQRITHIGKRYSHLYGSTFKQDVAMLRTTCHDIIAMMDDCFEMGMAAASRYRNLLEKYASKDNPTGIEVCAVYGILFDFMAMIEQSIPIKDLPSCKKLTELSTKDAIAAAKDLIKNDIVKAGIGLVLLGVKVGDMVHISHIKNFYNEQIELLQSDIEEIGRHPNEIESLLIDKFYAEIGYCNLAMLKTGLDSAKEVVSLADISKQNIQKYKQKQAQIQNHVHADISTMPILTKPSNL